MVRVTSYSYSRDIAKVDQEQSKISPHNSALLIAKVDELEDEHNEQEDK
jgi:hypothetical protein